MHILNLIILKLRMMEINVQENKMVEQKFVMGMNINLKWVTWTVLARSLVECVGKSFSTFNYWKVSIPRSIHIQMTSGVRANG